MYPAYYSGDQPLSVTTSPLRLVTPLGLEPRMFESKSKVLPITPWGNENEIHTYLKRRYYGRCK